MDAGEKGCYLGREVRTLLRMGERLFQFDVDSFLHASVKPSFQIFCGLNVNISVLRGKSLLLQTLSELQSLVVVLCGVY